VLKLIIVLGLALAPLARAQAPKPAAVDDQTAIQIEALSRLKGVDLEANAALKGAVLKVLEKTRGTPQFVELVREFKLPGHAPALLDYALQYSGESSGLEAFQLAAEELGRPALDPLLAGEKSEALVRLMGASGKEFRPALQSLVTDSQKNAAARKEAVRALARSEDGARFLLDLARQDQLPAEVRFAASSELNLASWPEIKKAALELLPLPQGSTEPLPPVAELLKRHGDPARGRQIFESPAAACASCHQIHGRGTEVGPALSEIGTKLGKDALYESILDPSAGISFGFEAWTIILKNEDEAFGLITSETNDEISLKAQTGVVAKIPKSEIAARRKMANSMMPAGLQAALSTQDLVDLVEYLASLKKPGGN